MRAVLFLVLSGCAASTPRPARVDLDGALAEWTAAPSGEPSSTVVARPLPREPVRIAARPRERLPQGRRVDARFHGAPIASALRLLADAADLGLVVGEGVEGTVSLDLRDVEPLTAMRAIAEAHRVELVLVGRTVIARRL